MITADSGYSSEQNLKYLKEENINSYIKLQSHEKMKTKAYKKDISKHYNMKKIEEESGTYYICSDGRKLTHKRTEVRKQGDLCRTFEVYGSNDCSECNLKETCFYKYDEEKTLTKTKP